MEIHSMTGFGEGEAENERYLVRVTVKSLNHRFTDVSVRSPEDLRFLEPALLRRVRGRVERGRVEVKIELRAKGDTERGVRLDRDLLSSYRELLGDAKAAGLIVDDSLAAADLLRLPEVIGAEPVARDWTAIDSNVVYDAIDSAIDVLVDDRRREGAELAAILGGHLEGLAGVVSRLDGMRVELQKGIRERFAEGIRELLDDEGLSKERLEQEVAILVDKADIREELDRLQVHQQAFGELLRGGSNPVGKRLDFLCQEIMRELNTIASKCRGSVPIQVALEGKAVCEQLREQVQNVQ